MLLCTMETVNCCFKHPEITHVKLRDEASLRRRGCSGQYERNSYCLASELAYMARL
jgi:hypothetical protein